MRTLRKILMILLATVFVFIACATFVYRNIPNGNTDLRHFDTLIVLGYPAMPDGTPSAEQRERTLEAVREYRDGVASHLIFTGGAAHNRFVEADVMKTFAVANGVPSNEITVDDRRRAPFRISTTATRVDQCGSNKFSQSSSSYWTDSFALFLRLANACGSMAG